MNINGETWMIESLEPTFTSYGFLQLEREKREKEESFEFRYL